MSGRVRGRAVAQRLVASALAITALLAARPVRCVAAQDVSSLSQHTRGEGEFLGVPKPRPTVTGGAERRVRVSLAEHRLYVMEGERVIWSAPVGTGTGTQLAGADTVWDFSTPRGEFQVQLKELDPVWNLPDWVFVERGEPIPPPDSPKRRAEGALGDAALYLTTDIAIHGTEHPELLGQDVSHGCIRMSNEAVRRLYEEVEVGTPVMIY